MINYYEVLGVDIKAEAIVIRSAYKAMSQKYHPDKAIGQKQIDEYLEKIKLINEAFGVLSDQIKRKKYDEGLSKNKKSEKTQSDEDSKKYKHSFDKSKSNQESTSMGSTSKKESNRNKKLNIIDDSVLFFKYLIVLFTIVVSYVLIKSGMTYEEYLTAFVCWVVIFIIIKILNKYIILNLALLFLFYLVFRFSQSELEFIRPGFEYKISYGDNKFNFSKYIENGKNIILDDYEKSVVSGIFGIHQDELQCSNDLVVEIVRKTLLDQIIMIIDAVLESDQKKYKIKPDFVSVRNDQDKLLNLISAITDIRLDARYAADNISCNANIKINNRSHSVDYLAQYVGDNVINVEVIFNDYDVPDILGLILKIGRLKARNSQHVSEGNQKVKSYSVFTAADYDRLGYQLPKFEVGTDYSIVRFKMLNLGWMPYHESGSDVCGPTDTRCLNRPEMRFCSATGRAFCGFLWKKEEKEVHICTEGEVIAVFHQFGDC